MQNEDINSLTKYMQIVNKYGVLKSFWYFSPIALWVVLGILIVKMVSKLLGI